MDFPKFVDLISTSKLFFVRIDKLRDKLEAELTQNIIDEIYDRYKNITDLPISPQEAKQRSMNDIKHIEKYKKYILVNCWSQNVDESYALWKIYLGTQIYGVSVQTKYDKLKCSLVDCNFDFLLQKVYYSNKVKDEKAWAVHFRKNKFYKFENEIRIAIFNQYVKFGGEPKYEVGTYAEVDLTNLIEKIYVSPFAPDSFFDFVQYIVEKYKYDFQIVKSKIKEI